MFKVSWQWNIFQLQKMRCKIHKLWIVNKMQALCKTNLSVAWRIGRWAEPNSHLYICLIIFQAKKYAKNTKEAELCSAALQEVWTASHHENLCFMHNLLCCRHLHSVKKKPSFRIKNIQLFGVFFKDNSVTLDQGFRGELVCPSKLLFWVFLHCGPELKIKQK